MLRYTITHTDINKISYILLLCYAISILCLTINYDARRDTRHATHGKYNYNYIQGVTRPPGPLFPFNPSPLGVITNLATLCYDDFALHY